MKISILCYLVVLLIFNFSLQAVWVLNNSSSNIILKDMLFLNGQLKEVSILKPGRQFKHAACIALKIIDQDNKIYIFEDLKIDTVISLIDQEGKLVIYKAVRVSSKSNL